MATQAIGLDRCRIGLTHPEQPATWLALDASTALDERGADVPDLQRPAVLDETRDAQRLSANRRYRFAVLIEPMPDVDHVGHDRVLPRHPDHPACGVRGIARWPSSTRRCPCTSRWPSIKQSRSPSSGALRNSEEAERAQRTVERWRILPSPERIAQQRNTCYAAAAKATATVPESLFAEMLQAGLDPAAVSEIVELCELDQVWRSMPEWWWQSTTSGETTAGASGQLHERWMRAFMQVQTRRLARFASKLISENETVRVNLSLLSSIPAPEHGIEPDRHLEQALRELTEARSAVQRLEERFPRLAALRAAGMPTQEVVTIGARLTALTDWFSTACVEDIASEIAESPALAAARLRAYEKKLASLQPLLSQAIIRTLPITELRKGLELDRRDSRITALPFDISHALVPGENGGSRAARLAFRPFDDNPDFGTVAVPVSIKTTSSRPARLLLRYSDFIEPDLKHWPERLRNRAQVLPVDVVELSEADWTKMPGVEKWQHSISCHVPLQRPKIDERITIRVTAHDPDTGTILGSSNKLEWTVSYVPSLDTKDPRPEIPLLWSEGINVEYVRNHPVGPQKHAARLLDRISAGDSFAVVAPRRFGKSTLIEHLQSVLSEKQTPTKSVVCADFRVPGSITIDHRRLWQRIAEELPPLVPRQPHVALAFDSGSPPLPTAESFDALRRALHDAQKPGLVVFLDEAHLIFAGGNPVEYSSRLRTLLSTRLSRRDADKAPLMFAFFGVPTMSSSRMGELWPYLNPIRDHSLDDDELHRLARQFTNGRLEMTREARERIVALSSNLLILQRVLRRVRDHVQKQFRTWVIRQDVLRVEEVFKQELLRGDDPESVRRYLLDVLNDSVDLEFWRPSPAYPLALALAVAHKEKYRGDEARTFAQVQLSSWAGVLFKDATSLPSFDDPTATEEHFQTLAELDIYKRGRFSSEFLECALAGSVDSTQLPTDAQFADTLLRAGVPTVRLPRERVFISRGGQAEVFRSPDLNLAIRTAVIETQEERDRFLGRLSLFEVVRKLERGNDPRVAHIMRLRDAGLAEVGGATCAVQTYDWIDGETLEERKKKAALPTSVVIEVGQQIASALSLLHEQGVWHRDVCPRNIILQENQLFAVLIDFGFATFSNRGRTALATNDAFPAPEVRLNPPHWSAGADVFSLARTIESLLPAGSKEAGRIRRALQPFVAERLSERGNLSSLIVTLEQIEHELNSRGVIRSFQESLLKLVQDESLNAVLRRRARDLDGFALGLYAHHGERCAKIANLVNQVAEYKRHLSLGEWLHGVYGAERHPDEIRIYVALRNTDSHGTVDLSNTRFARYWNDPRPLIRQGIGDIADWLGIRELPKVVEFLLAADRPVA